MGNRNSNNKKTNITTYYIGDRFVQGSKNNRRVSTVLGYDEKKNAILFSVLRKKAQRYSFKWKVLSTYTKWCKLAKNERWGGVRPENPPPAPPSPIVQQTALERVLERLQILYPVVSTIDSGFDFPDLPYKAGESQKVNYWKYGDRWMNYLEYVEFLEERALEVWGRVPLCIEEMSPCYGSSPSPSRDSDDESW